MEVKLPADMKLKTQHSSAQKKKKIFGEEKLQLEKLHMEAAGAEASWLIFETKRRLIYFFIFRKINIKIYNT